MLTPGPMRTRKADLGRDSPPTRMMLRAGHIISYGASMLHDATTLMPSLSVRGELAAVHRSEPRLARLGPAPRGPVADAHLVEIRNADGARLYSMVSIPVPGVAGRLYAGPSPGYGPDCGPRLDALRLWGLHRVICLVPSLDLGDLLGSPGYEAAARARWGDGFILHGIVDYEAPGNDAAFEALVDDTVAALQAGEAVLVHCALGCGRTGLLAACILVAQGADPIDAIETFRQVRRCGPESGDQLAYVVRYARRRVSAASPQ